MKTYVNNAYGTLKKVLLCPIDNYQIMPINFVAKKDGRRPPDGL